MQSKPSASFPSKSHTRRKMTEQEKIDYRRRRLLRACPACAGSKRKCNHNQTEGEARLLNRLERGKCGEEILLDQGASIMVSPKTPAERLSSMLYSNSLENADGLSWYQNLGTSPTDQEDSEGSADEIVLSSSVLVDKALNLHKPQAPGDLSVMIFAENIQWAGVGDSWFGEAPIRLGHDSCYDLAIDALNMVCWYGRKLSGATLAKVYRVMGASLDALHEAMSKDGAVLNDHVLATVAALSPVDAIRTGHSFLVSGHLDGVAMILRTQAAAKPLSSMARRILEYHICDNYVMAAVRGTVSPFETLDPLYFEYTDESKPAAERKMRAIGNKLCVRLPRLIMYVRLACGIGSNGSTIASALSLAEELLELRDESAETEFLHAVGLTLTKLPQDRKITEFSLDFKSLSSLEAASYYWHSRTTFLRLCSRLRTSFPAYSNMYALPSAMEIQEELQGYASKIVMGLQYARTNTARKRRRLFGQSLLACWGTLQDYPNTLSNECDASEIDSWLLNTINITLFGRHESLGAHDLNEATELFQGGPLVGVYKDLYDPPTSVQP